VSRPAARLTRTRRRTCARGVQFHAGRLCSIPRLPELYFLAVAKGRLVMRSCYQAIRRKTRGKYVFLSFEEHSRSAKCWRPLSLVLTLQHTRTAHLCQATYCRVIDPNRRKLAQCCKVSDFKEPPERQSGESPPRFLSRCHGLFLSPDASSLSATAR
jgi:hypothetical protein